MGLLTLIFLKSKWFIEIGNIFAGISCIAFGIYLLYITYKLPDTQLSNTNVKGYFGGIGIIIVSIMFIFGQISISDF